MRVCVISAAPTQQSGSILRAAFQQHQAATNVSREQDPKDTQEGAFLEKGGAPPTGPVGAIALVSPETRLSRVAGRPEFSRLENGKRFGLSARSLRGRKVRSVSVGRRLAG